MPFQHRFWSAILEDAHRYAVCTLYSAAQHWSGNSLSMKCKIKPVESGKAVLTLFFLVRVNHIRSLCITAGRTRGPIMCSFMPKLIFFMVRRDGYGHTAPLILFRMNSCNSLQSCLNLDLYQHSHSSQIQIRLILYTVMHCRDTWIMGYWSRDVNHCQIVGGLLSL